MKVKEFLEEMNRLAPFDSALEWDNVGLLLGRTDSRIEGIFIALDISDNAVKKAVENKCQLILTHHPVIFSPMRRIDESTPAGSNLLYMAEHKINCIAMHTNFDVHIMGDIAAKKLGLPHWEVLDITETANKPRGIGIISKLDKTVELSAMADNVKRSFNLPFVAFYGNEDDRINTVAMVPGSGKDEIGLAAKRGADVIITGDVPYHYAMDSRALNLDIIDAGHYGIEHIFIEYMGEYIRNKFKKINVVCEKIEFPRRAL